MAQYFGYCKKEVKTQLAYTANLYGQTEEEHAGGCLAYPSYDLGEEFSAKELGKVSAKVCAGPLARQTDVRSLSIGRQSMEA